MENKGRAACNWAKIKHALIAKKGAQTKLAAISPFQRRTVCEDEEGKLVEYSHDSYRWICY